MEPLNSISVAQLQGSKASPSAAKALNWYALRVFNNRTLWFRKVIDQKVREDSACGVETYIAMTSGDTVQKPLVASLMFIKCTERFLKELKMDHLSGFSYYTRYADLKEPEPQFQDKDLPKKQTKRKRYSAPLALQKVPAVIPDDQMRTFIWLTSEDFNVKYLGEPKNLKLGDRVRIISGVLKGQVGNIKRIKKDRKFVITIGNVAAFTIEGITHDMMEKIEDDNTT